MPQSRHASGPIAFQKPTGQCSVTRAGKRIYLGADRDSARGRYPEYLTSEFAENAEDTRKTML